MAFRPLPARAPAVLLREARPLKALFSQAQRLAQLQKLLDSQLQPAAREHCHIASWREGTLLLIVTDGHWATRLRYQQKRLQRQLQTLDAFASLTRILFKVQPPTTQSRAATHTADLSTRAAESIQATADGISDPKLRAALERLASHARDKETPES
ncbi:MAG: DciA family protein [Pseudomonas sp.]